MKNRFCKDKKIIHEVGSQLIARSKKNKFIFDVFFEFNFLFLPLGRILFNNNIISWKIQKI